MSEVEPADDRPQRITRIGNPERAQLLSLLREAVDDGYLDLEEFDERQQLVMASKSAEEAEVAVEDLPHYQEIQDNFASQKDQAIPLWMIAVWIAWGAAIGVNFAVWGLVFLATGSTAAFWPVWVLVSSGIPIGALALLEKHVIRPAVADYRRQKRQGQRPRFRPDSDDS